MGRGCLGGVGAGVVRLSHRTWEVTARSGIQVSKKQNVSSPPTRKSSVMWRASVTIKEVGHEFRILCLINLTIPRPCLAYVCPKVA